MAHSVTVAKISEYKRKQTELSHRVLKVSQCLEKKKRNRKIGYTVLWAIIFLVSVFAPFKVIPPSTVAQGIAVGGREKKKKMMTTPTV